MIAFIRTIELHCIDYAIIAKSYDDSIFLTQYNKRVIAVRKSVPLLLEDIINSIKIVKEKLNVDEFIIAPTTEALNRFLLKNRIQFEQESIRIPLISEELYKSISDKHSFSKLCENNGIKVPHEYSELNDVKLPFVAKPKEYVSSDNKIYTPFICISESDKQAFLIEHQTSGFFFQEYIHGRSFYLLYYFNQNGKIYKFSQENLIQQPNGKSIVAAISSNFHASEESFKYEQLLNSLNFSGLIMIEIKMQGNENFMIEANPRFWGPSQLFVDAKMNFFETFLHDLGMLKAPPNFNPPNKVIRYFWFGGILEAIKQNKELKFHKGNKTELMKELHVWMQTDIYKRNDTINIFENELK